MRPINNPPDCPGTVGQRPMDNGPRLRRSLSRRLYSSHHLGQQYRTAAEQVGEGGAYGVAQDADACRIEPERLAETGGLPLADRAKPSTSARISGSARFATAGWSWAWWVQRIWRASGRHSALSCASLAGMTPLHCTTQSAFRRTPSSMSWIGWQRTSRTSLGSAARVASVNR